MTRHVLFLVTQMEPAGAQKIALDLSREFRDRGYDTTLAVFYDKGNFVETYRNLYGVEIINLEAMPAGRPFNVLFLPALVVALYRLYRLMRKRQTVVFQSFTHYSNILGPCIAWLARVPVRLTSQRNSLRTASRVLRGLDRMINNSGLVHRMVAVSEQTRQFSIHTEGIREETLVTIHNGVDVPVSAYGKDLIGSTALRRELGIEDASCVVLTVARMHPQKGYAHLVDAASPVTDHFPTVRFLLVGEGSCRDKIASQVTSSGLSSSVQLLGLRQDIPELMKMSDIFVLPSLWEGLPNVVLEAMAHGLPIIASAVDGCIELVDDGKTGRLVVAGDADLLAAAMIELMENPSRAAAMGKAGRDRVREAFSRSAMVRRYEDLYRELMLEHGVISNA